MKLKFVNQNITNGNFELWTENNLPSFWVLEDYAITSNCFCSGSSNPASGSYYLVVKATNSSGSGKLYSSPFRITNESGSVSNYIFQTYYRFTDYISGDLVIDLIEYDNEMNELVVNNVLSTGSADITNWTLVSTTVNDASSSADIKLNPNTIYVKTRIEYGGTTPSGSVCVDDVRLGGNVVCELDRGSVLPYTKTIVPLQEVSEALGGTITCHDRNKDYIFYSLNFEGLSESNYEELLAFFNSNEVLWQYHHFRFRDYDGSWHIVWYIDESFEEEEMPPGIYKISFNLRNYNG
jgi:hypothetical protein